MVVKCSFCNPLPLGIQARWGEGDVERVKIVILIIGQMAKV